MKRKREPSQKTTVQKKKILNLGKSLATKKKPAPLTFSSAPSGNISISEVLNSSVSVSRKLASSIPLPPPIISTTVTTSSTPPTININVPTEKSKSQQPTTLLPSHQTSSQPTPSEPTPSIPIHYELNPSNQTHSKPTPSQSFPSEPTNSEPIPLRTIIPTPSPPSPLFNLQPTSIPRSEAMLFNESFSPTVSTTYNTTLYYDLTTSSEHSGSDHPDRTSPNLEDILATIDPERTLSAEREATEKAAKEVAEKGAAKEKSEIEAEATRVTEAAQKAESEKAVEVTRIQGESSTADLAPLVINTLEELQKEQQLVRIRLGKQDQVNNNIQNLLAELLQRMPPPPKL
ncbi:flocculation protein FLO11-like [Lathyrus oleraceus]|uniref:flocculation protein FLO11-like n=1 Tax=Pisum sativum TaxID=3888 RepID=UPI0021CE270F|nr:flocculation protein FLO11-like [Pisum sativum]